MIAVGSIRHVNVSPLRAYYYSKDERLMVYDFYEEGSVSAMLHGMSKTFSVIHSVMQLSGMLLTIENESYTLQLREGRAILLWTGKQG
jgi:hypothetical protein